VYTIKNSSIQLYPQNCNLFGDNSLAECIEKVLAPKATASSSNLLGGVSSLIRRRSTISDASVLGPNGIAESSSSPLVTAASGDSTDWCVLSLRPAGSGLAARACYFVVGQHGGFAALQTWMKTLQVHGAILCSQNLMNYSKDASS
jgi:hypothetical protein